MNNHGNEASKMSKIYKKRRLITSIICVIMVVCMILPLIAAAL